MRQQKDGESEVYGEAFWRFSLAFYARAGVAEALIALQDRAGFDVNLILFALWRGAAHGYRLNAAELEKAAAAAASLRHEIVAPVRELRRRLKSERDGDIKALRRQIAVLELAAERAAQYRLASTVSAVGSAAIGEGDRRAAAEANLALYLGGEARSDEAHALRGAIGGFLARG